MRVREILKITRGKLLSGNPGIDIDPAGISTDSRMIKKGEFFIALRGPNFDGNEYVGNAFRNGAVGAITLVDSPQSIVHRKIIIQVKDTTKALQAIAAAHRKRFRIPVIAVTGSNGKTTVKEMVWAVLSEKYNVLKNEGTKNNHIGVPQTLLKIKKSHDICVLELGANHKGEIRSLSRIARPTAAVITNIGPSHLEFLQDLEGVFKEKRTALDSLDRSGIAILNGDDEYLSRIKKGRFGIIRFGLGKGNDFMGEILSARRDMIRFKLNGAEEFELNLLGIHNVYNALAAIAAGCHFNISYGSIRHALSNYRPTYRRLDLKRVRDLNIIDDSYNSNPLSMAYALEAIRRYPAPSRWVVSGDMLELGSSGIRFHKMIGKRIASSKVEGLLTLGELSKHTLAQAKKNGMDARRLWHCSSHAEAAGILRRVAKKGDVVLVKGSRGMRMEEVLEKLKGQG